MAGDLSSGGWQRELLPCKSPRAAMKRLAWVSAIAILAYIGIRNWAELRPHETPRARPAARPAPHQISSTLSLPDRGSSPAPDPSRIGIATGPPIASGPRVEERVEYYEVSGSSARELALAMRVLGPTGAQGTLPLESVAATTRWDVRWQAQYSSAEGRCAIKSFSTSVPTVMVLPRWTGRVAGSPLAEQWDRLAQEILTHERGHAERGIAAAKAFQEGVAALAPMVTCPALDESINSTYDAVIRKYRQEDIEYDRRERDRPTRVRFETEDDDRAAWIASRGQVPLRRVEPTVADSEMTETHRRRRAGADEYETGMIELSEQATLADGAWRLFRQRCGPLNAGVSAGAVAGARAWFGYAWDGPPSARTMQSCAEARTFYALVDQVKDGMCVAEEKARRSFVYAGTRRELRTQYRLEWDGWDRVCR